jgi:hypothetical protein
MNRGFEITFTGSEECARIKRRIEELRQGERSAWVRAAIIAKIEKEEGGGNDAAPVGGLTKADILDILEQYLQQPLAATPEPVQETGDEADDLARAKALFAQAEQSFR